MFFTTKKLLFFTLLNSTTRNKSNNNIFIGKNIRLRNYHKKFPLSGIKVAIIKGPFNSKLILPKLFENFGAEITVFCDTSNRKRNIDLNLTNSDFVKAHVYGNRDKRFIESGEREIDLSVDGDLNLLKKYAFKSDIFIDGLNDKRFERMGFNPKEILKINSKLIFAKITDKFNQPNSHQNNVVGKDSENSEEFLESLNQLSKNQMILGQISCFAKILLTLLNKQNFGKGQILELSIQDSLHQLDRILSTLPSIPKTFDRFYFTKDNKIFALSLPSSEDQQKFLKSLNLTDSKDVPSKIQECHLSELNILLKGLNNIAQNPFNYNCETNGAKLQNDEFYEFDRKKNHWIKNNFYHFSPSF